MFIFIFFFNMAAKKRKVSWKEYEQNVASAKNGGTVNKKKNIPTFITVQRMSSEPLERLKKYEPLETREFVDFTEYEELTIENIKGACEKHYDAPSGSCDVLLGDNCLKELIL